MSGKKGVMFLVFIGMFVLALGSVSAACVLSADLINQDPYPAVPGEYVKVLFQVKGIENSECGKIKFEFVPEFPFSLDPGAETGVTITGGNYYSDYKNVLQVPYKVRVDKQAIVEESPLTVRFTSTSGGELYVVKKFNVTVENVVTDFEVYVRNYDKTTNQVTFEILNVGENDVEALSIDLPKQPNFEVKGSNRNIVGSLDSNEDTTFSFEGTPKDGELILKISYTDKVNTRRVIEKTVMFDSSRFNGRASNQSSTSGWFYISVLLILVIGYIIWRNYKHIKKIKENHKKILSGK